MFKKVQKIKNKAPAEVGNQPSPTKAERVIVFIGGVLGIIGGILGVCSYFHSLSVEKKIEARSCMGELGSYPWMFREAGQRSSDTLFKWIATSDLPRKRAAKSAMISLQNQLKTTREIIKKYSCAISQLDQTIDSLDRIILNIKNDIPEKVDVDGYSKRLTQLVELDPFSKVCCPAIK